MSLKHCSLPLKTAAFLLTIAALVLGVLCGVAAGFLADQGAYTLRKADMLDQGLQTHMEQIAPDIASAFAQETYGDGAEDLSYSYFYDGRYAPYPKAYTQQSNYRYVIRDTAGNVLKSSYQGEPYLSLRETVVEGVVYYAANTCLSLDEPLVVTGYVLENMDIHDFFSYYVKVVDTFYAYRGTLILVALTCLVLVICTVVYLFSAAGHQRDQAGIVLNLLDKLPGDLYLAAVALAILGLAAVFYYATRWQTWILLTIGCAALALGGTLILGFFLSVAARVKFGRGYWWRRTLLGGGLRLVFWLLRCFLLGIRSVFRLLPVIWRWLAGGAALTLGCLLLLGPCYDGGWRLLLALFLLAAATVYLAWSLGQLRRATHRMAGGNLREELNTRRLFGIFRQMGTDLNALGQGASLAVEQQLRSERMKTELITNVSHDIKTPLTSIVNYVDLLQKPHTPDQGRQYLEVLSRQSHRLKKLTEDLVELSKATSGSIPVTLAPTDAAELVNQALAEYQLKLERAHLRVVLRIPEGAVPVEADGRLFWRVMDNLLGNCVKYALPGTRVYIDVVEFENKVMISVKNISREPLNLPAEELMERFVREDRSRNTEGSGLGLNIAKTLMELQHGALRLQIDGDLFKAMVLFDRLASPETEKEG